MRYQQAGRIAVLKRIAGWIIFVPALLSTLISLLNFAYQYKKSSEGINAVMLDFVQVMVDMIRFNTSSLNIFWYNSPLPILGQGVTVANILFFTIYWLIFVGLALEASGARIQRQVKYIREGIQDQLILEQTKEDGWRTKQQLEDRVVLPRHTLLLQYFPLYILPIILGIIAYFVLILLGLIV